MVTNRIEGNTDETASLHGGVYLTLSLYHTHTHTHTHYSARYSLAFSSPSFKKLIYVDVDGSSNPEEKLNVASSSSGFMAVWSRKKLALMWWT